jgi:hypothetical protein
MAHFTKAFFEVGMPLRVGFIGCYFLWLLAEDASGIEKGKKKVNVWSGIASIAVFTGASYGLFSIPTFIPALILIIYPLSAMGVIFSGLMLMPLLALEKKMILG